MVKDQSGFGIIESLLLLIALAIIGFSGFYVWEKQQGNGKPDTASESSTAKTSDNDLVKKAVEPTVKKQSFSTYGIKVTVGVPEGWEATGVAGYVADYEYLIDITNAAKEIELSL